MNQHIGYSKYITPLNVLIDLILVVFLAKKCFANFVSNEIYFYVFLSATWIAIALYTHFYSVYRFTNPVQILSKIISQTTLFFFTTSAYFSFQKENIFSFKAALIFISVLFVSILIIKYLFFINIKRYRLLTKSNYRNVVIVGITEESQELKKIFETRADYGYRFLGFFSNKQEIQDKKGNLNDLQGFIQNNNVHEIYSSLKELSDEEIKSLIYLSEDNKISLKFVPDNKKVLSKKLRLDYYGFFPVLTLQKTPLHIPSVHFLKRIFDIVFSLIVIVFLLSWLIPIMALLIKLESKGPVFFKQSRPGFDEQEFFCFKFRSMKLNQTTEQEASRNDPRVTRIGKFIRKTSIDELPQFFNVLFGDMSIVGPRPHLWTQNKVYGKKIDRYMVRHYVKPGITGLAQVKGYRGEIETDKDMINRINYDVYYIENWSFLLDVKIIFQTVINIFQGEEKAY